MKTGPGAAWIAAASRRFGLRRLDAALNHSKELTAFSKEASGESKKRRLAAAVQKGDASAQGFIFPRDLFKVPATVRVWLVLMASLSKGQACREKYAHEWLSNLFQPA